MRTQCLIICGVIFLTLFSVRTAVCFAQVNETTRKSDIDELTRDVIRHKQKAKIYSGIEVNSIYETNAALGSIRKGDLSQEYLYTLGLNRLLPHGFNYSLNYDLDVVQHNEMTDLTIYLNHIRTGVHKSLGKAFVVGGGVDLSYLVYPYYDAGDSFFYKYYTYVRHNITDKTYHQVLVETGRKYYPNAEAIAESLSDLQEKKRQDKRDTIEYTIGSVLTSKFFAKLRGRFFINDGNAQFQDFYDYTAYEVAPKLYYKLSDKISLNAGLSYLLRLYKNREITVGGKREKDNVYGANTGMQYKFNPNHSVSLSYGYRQALSNDSFSEYSGSTFSGGWRYDF